MPHSWPLFRIQNIMDLPIDDLGTVDRGLSGFYQPFNSGSVDPSRSKACKIVA